VIYANVDTLGGWTKPQIYFFLGIFFASDALFTTFFQRNFWQFSDLVNRGELDTLLTKPANPLFLALTRYMNATALFNFAMGIAITIRFSHDAGFLGGYRWLYLPFWLFFGLFTAIQIRMLFSLPVFWTERSWAISRLYYQFFAFATKPDTIYPFWIRYVILTFIPFAFIGSVPARALLEGLSAGEMLRIVLVLGAFNFINRFLWKQGLRRYQSASS
jgi:ABC-2 type transport system permease protein